MPQLWLILVNLRERRRNSPRNMNSSAAFMPQRERVSWSCGGLAILSRGPPGSWGIHQQLMEPSIATLYAAKDFSILVHFSQSEREGEMAPINMEFPSAFYSPERVFRRRWFPNTARDVIFKNPYPCERGKTVK